jgi:hypothetical protein
MVGLGILPGLSVIPGRQLLVFLRTALRGLILFWVGFRPVWKRYSTWREVIRRSILQVTNNVQ